MSSPLASTTQASPATSELHHHWNCVNAGGHPDGQFECTVPDGSHRFPDGSIICRKEIQGGHIFAACHGPEGLEVYGARPEDE